MRVLYVNQTSQMSGAERSLLALLAGLGDAVAPLVACPPGELSAALDERGVPRAVIAGTRASFKAHPVQTPRSLFDIGRSAVQLRRLAAHDRAELVHANTTRAALLALLGRRRGGPPVLAHIRDWAPDGRFPRAVHSFIARRADAVVANSAYVAEIFDGMPSRAPVRVIHNPVELGAFDPAALDGAAVRRELGLAEDALALAVVAQLTPWKGQDDAIRALAELPSEAGSPVLLVVGSAKFAGAGTRLDNEAYERDLHRLVVELGVADRVRFLGERTDVPDVLAATDLLLLPSWREAFGRIAVEGMAVGVPVVSTNVGGPAEIIRDGVDGLLLPPRRPELWAERIVPLLADHRRRLRMGESGRERAAGFSPRAHAEAMLDAYRALLEPRAR